MGKTAEDAVGYSLLVVEDEDGLRRSIANYFTDSGFRVAEASSGREGIELFRAEQPDIVFTDLCMPCGNGLELIAALQVESPLTPIVVISGAGMIDDAVAAIKMGACDYLSKPIRDMAALQHLALQAVGRLRQQRKTTAAGEDHLTGLRDRSHMEPLFQAMAANCQGITLVLLDLDSFKAIKDVLGHLLADRLLLEVGKRLSRHMDTQDTIVHLGGDEFAMLLSTSDRAHVDVRVDTLMKEVAGPFKVGQDDFIITASIGMAAFPHDARCVDELLKHASTALFEAKKSGRNSVRRYCPTIPTNSERFLLQTRLRRAFDLQQFSLVYQPQYDLAGGALHGFEALLRWQQDLWQVPPAQFIPALEETGLIVQVGEWILREACTRYQEWQSLGVPPCMLSVNVSAVQFRANGFVEMVRRVLYESGMAAEFLCLELTESVVMRDCEETIATMSKLKALGISLSLDDFGTGYSSLSYLSRMPLDELKIDRSFVASLPSSTNNASIVDTIISMAACMNLRVVAEGIELEGQVAFLREKKCQIAQGFYFSRPLTPVDVIYSLGGKAVGIL